MFDIKVFNWKHIRENENELVYCMHQTGTFNFKQYAHNQYGLKIIYRNCLLVAAKFLADNWPTQGGLQNSETTSVAELAPSYSTHTASQILSCVALRVCLFKCKGSL